MMNTYDKNDPKNRFCEFSKLMNTLISLSKLLNQYQSAPRTYGTEDELFMVEVHTLSLIGRHRGITASEIAARTHRTKGAVSQIVEKLLDKGLVVKEKDPTDNRRLTLSLTQKGLRVHEFHEELDKTHYSAYLSKIQDVDAEDLIITRETLEKLLNNANLR